MSGLADVGISRNLAFFMGLLPLSNSKVQQESHTLESEIIDRLAEDGWIELRGGPEAGTWHVAHDVLADQMLLSYLESKSRTMQMQLSQFLERAVALACPDVALVTLQRIVGQPAVKGVDWSLLLGEALHKACVSVARSTEHFDSHAPVV